MLKTPKECLGPDYPLQTPEQSKVYQPIWRRAFEIHQTSHDWDNKDWNGLSKSSIHPIDTAVNYCDCYIRAWLEFHKDQDLESYIAKYQKDLAQELTKRDAQIAKLVAQKKIEKARAKRRVQYLGRATRIKAEKERIKAEEERKVIALRLEFEERQV